MYVVSRDRRTLSHKEEIGDQCVYLNRILEKLSVSKNGSFFSCAESHTNVSQNARILYRTRDIAPRASDDFDLATFTWRALFCCRRPVDATIRIRKIGIETREYCMEAFDQTHTSLLRLFFRGGGHSLFSASEPPSLAEPEPALFQPHGKVRARPGPSGEALCMAAPCKRHVVNDATRSLRV